MRWPLSKEKALFLIGTLLLAWVLFRLGLSLTQQPSAPAAPALAACSVRHGDPDIRSALEIPPLATYLGPGDPFRLAPREIRRRPTPPATAAGEKPPVAAVFKPTRLARDEAGPPRTREQTAGPDARLARERNPRLWTIGPRTEEPDPALKLVATVSIHGSGASRWAVLRDRRTGELRRVAIGDMLPGRLRLADITDDAATVVTPRGARLTLPGRFDARYSQ